MDHNRPLAPCLIGSGTLTNPRDMIRALETLETLDYEYEVDGQIVAEGSATLVKLMADGDSATLAVNGCLFLNVASFRYLDFCTEDDVAVMRLFGEGTVLTLRSDIDAENAVVARGQLRLLEESPFDLESFVISEDEDEDE